MNIIVPATSFPRTGDDAAGRFVFDLSRGLAELGHRLVHIVPKPSQPSDDRLLLPDGIEVREVPVGLGNWGGALAYGAGIGPNITKSPWLGVAVPSLMRSLKAGISAALNEEPNSSILSHWVFPSGLIAAEIAQRKGAHHVSVAHGGGLQALLRSRLTKSWLTGWAEGTNAAVFVSEDLKNKAIRALGDQMPENHIVQPMGIDARSFMPCGESDEIPSNSEKGEPGLTLLGVGRLIELKGFDLLIRAAAEFDHARVIICGDGPEKSTLANLAKSLAVPCQFLGQLSPRRLGAQYRAADLLIIPSRLGKKGRSEGSPMVVLEAMSQGLPFVGSKTGGLPSLASDSGAGRTFVVNKSHDLVRAIRDLTVEDCWQETMREEALRFAAKHQYSVMAKAVEGLLLLGE
ncbi:MAG: glycosyltransferase involved in cell wall biosynthesis [Planctomycetota bacterium]